MDIICDLGGTHSGGSDHIKKALDLAKEVPSVWLKAQLWSPNHPAAAVNPTLDWSTFERAYRYAQEIGVEFSASVFDKTSYEFLSGLRPKWIKFAYSMRDSPLVARAIGEGNYVIVSKGWMDTDAHIDTGAGLTLLMPCPGAYPVLTTLDVQPQWFQEFDGLSDHTLGAGMIKRAADCGCIILEKHVRFPGWGHCPDARFALDWELLWK